MRGFGHDNSEGSLFSHCLPVWPRRLPQISPRSFGMRTGDSLSREELSHSKVSGEADHSMHQRFCPPVYESTFTTVPEKDVSLRRIRVTAVEVRGSAKKGGPTHNRSDMSSGDPRSACSDYRRSTTVCRIASMFRRAATAMPVSRLRGDGGSRPPGPPCRFSGVPASHPPRWEAGAPPAGEPGAPAKIAATKVLRPARRAGLPRESPAHGCWKRGDLCRRQITWSRAGPC